MSPNRIRSSHILTEDGNPLIFMAERYCILYHTISLFASEHPCGFQILVVIKCCVKYRGCGLILFPLDIHPVSGTAGRCGNSVPVVVCLLTIVYYSI